MNSILGVLLLMTFIVVSANNITLSTGSIPTISTGTTTTATIPTKMTGTTTTASTTSTTASTTKIVPEIRNLTVLAQSTSELNVSWSSYPQNCTFWVMYNLTETNSTTPHQLLQNLTAGHIYNVSVWAEYNGEKSAVETQANQTFMDCKNYKWLVNTTEILVNITEPFLCVEAKRDNEAYNQSGKNIHFQNLSPGCEYNISIISEFGFTLCTTTVYLDPSPVTNLIITNRTTNQTTVSWTPPNDRDVTLYKYNVTTKENVIVTTKETVTETNTSSCTIEDLEAGVGYNICVQSITVGNTISSETCVTVYTDPSPVTNLIITNRTINQTTVSWTPPNDRDVTLYKYNVTTKENVIASTKETVTETNTSSCTVKGLEAGVGYNICVQSITVGNTISSETCVTVYTDPSKPIFDFKNVTTNSVQLHWKAPNNINIKDYRYSVNWSSADQTNNNITKNLFMNISSLTPGNLYNITIQSLIADVSSEGLLLKIRTDPAKIPQIICQNNAGENNIHLLWSVPEGVWDKIELNVSSGKQYTVTNRSCTKECTQEIDGLLPATSYKFMLFTVSYDIKSAPTMIECMTSIVGVATGTTIALLIIILLIIIVIFFLRRDQEPSKPSGFPIKHSDSMKNKPITISNFPSHFYCKHRDTDFGFSEDYQSLRSVGTNQSTNAALLLENKNKNRFTNVLPYDCSRVKLQKDQENHCSDYINANFMPGYYSSKEFIAAQGPLPNTVADFWQMIWEQNVQAVVMVTNCQEGNKVKCEQYWPEDCKPCVYEDILVTTVSDKEMEEWTLREFHVKHVKTLESRIIKHFHFTAWPDHGVPDKTQSLIAFRELVRSFMNQLTRNAPVVVHCSAGVGRTGTFIALDYLLLQLSNEMAVSVYSFVQRMRKNRPLMVQTESQYIFLHQCMLDTINALEANSEPVYENSDCIYANELALKEVNNFNSIPS
ncbi:receptor-type tyrosine-protein phosphatase H-like isoform X4 [Erpetoichthys calabaricus]|uniref:receptor-type tyrosine-protein phosphatase H-like isoform X4 n=1 Tax=Erpetoichthys calabaricus TaxID=27687 RepID=UPI00223418DB|nr:receptor-type tyrosine-protein phosphatase H-like isoform X4 [Erpetoichthys calabaricus]